jgi:preprotein translocase subunit SecA
MTGTADTEAPEFKKIYDLSVIIMPTHQPMIRKDYADVIYKNEAAKYRAVVSEIKALHEKGQPVLVGTISIDVSEKIAEMLIKENVPHDVLNAKQHEREAEIIAGAGQLGKVTIATNMAGRGTDIKLGEGVREVGGLHILGTSRHESRRIDNQLRGRSGRQGDPGSSRFYLSLEDDLLRIFGSGRIAGIMDKLGMEEDEPIEHNMISKAIENAQRKVEGHNFDIRKHLLEYDDVMNMQREVIYRQRREVLAGEDMAVVIKNMATDLTDGLVEEIGREHGASEDWDWQDFAPRMLELFNIRANWTDQDKSGLDKEGFRAKLHEIVANAYSAQEQRNTLPVQRHLERVILLQTVDTLWKEHLLAMDHLKQGIGLRGYGQKNPLIEYKKEGYNLFLRMIETVKTETVSTLMRVQVALEDEVAKREEEYRQQQAREIQLNMGAAGVQEPTPPPRNKPAPREVDKVGRNADCPCGSGKKFKKCCGAPPR